MLRQSALGRKRSIQAHRQPQLKFHYLRHAERNFSFSSSHLTRRRDEEGEKTLCNQQPLFHLRRQPTRVT